MRPACLAFTRAWLRALLLFCGLCAAAAAHATVVRLQTTQGLVDIRLLDAEAPATVANFLSYVRSGAYAGTFVHRSVPGFIVQGGGYRWVDGVGGVRIPSNPPVINEFSPTRSNVRATVAMAKLGGDPNSATNEWFVNLANNASNLDNQNGGFTVFGRVTGPGMAVIDAIAGLQRVSISGTAFTDLPLVSFPADRIVRNANLVGLISVQELPAALGDADRIFNYLEAAYPQYAPLPGSSAGVALGYVYRYYPQSNAYVGIQGGNVYYLVPAIDNNINLLGSVAEWLATATAAGY